MTSRSENILIMGAYGRLGTELSLFLSKTHNVLRLGRNESAQVCITDLTVSSLENVLKSYNIGIIVNLIADTDVDRCQRDPLQAFFSNAVIPQYINSAVNEVNSEIFILQVSTDQVYSGKGLHKEHQYKPCNVYGISKLAGEIAVATSGNVCVLRTNYFGFSPISNRTSYFDWLTDSITKQKKISIFQNVFFSPLGSSKLCSIILLILTRKLTGTYNLGSNRAISKAEFAQVLANKLRIFYPQFEYSDYSSRANVKRPLDMSMNSKRLLDKLKMDPIIVENEISIELSNMTRK